MRRFKKIIFILFLTLIVLIAGLFYLNNIFLPFQAKDMLTAKAKSLLQRDVSIERVEFQLNKGFVLHNIRVAEKDNRPLSFISIEEIQIGIPLPSFFQTGHIFIPSAKMTKPIAHLIRASNNQWNFTDLLIAKARTSQPTNKIKAKESFLSLGAITIEKGQLVVSDPSNTKVVDNFDATITLALPNNISFATKFTIPSDHSTFTSKGQFNLTTQELTAAIQTQNLNPPSLIHLTGVPLYVVFNQWLISNADLLLRFKKGALTLSGSIAGPIDITTKTDIPVSAKGLVISKEFTFHKENSDFNLKGDFSAADTAITVGANKTFSGNFSGENINLQKTNTQFTLTGDLFNQNAKMSFAQHTLNGDLKLKNIVFHKDGSHFDLSTQSQITKASFKNSAWDIAADFSSAQWSLQNNEKDLTLTIPNFSTQNLSGDFLKNKISGHAIGQNIQIRTDIANFNAQGYFTTQNLKITTPNQITFIGHPQIDLTLTQNAAVDQGKLNPKGTILFNNDQLQNIPTIKTIHNLQGKISFTTDTVASKELTLKLDQTILSLSGTIDLSKTPVLKITAKSNNVIIDDVKKFFIQKLSNLQTDIWGTAQNVSVTYDGLLSSPQSAIITAAATIKNAKLNTAKLPAPIIQINGQVKYVPDHFSWTDLGFSYQEQNYATDGFVKNFTTPHIESTLRGENFNIALAGSPVDNAFSLTLLKGQYHQTTFDLQGTLNLFNAPPNAQFNGTVALNLTDLSSLPIIPPALKQASLDGIINFDGQYFLPDLAWQKLSLNAKATAKELNLYGHSFQNVFANLTTHANKSQNIKLDATLYHGQLSLDATLTPTAKDLFADISANLSELNLAELKHNFPKLENKDLSGLLYANTKFSGPLANSSALKGTGAILITDGKLLELEMLKGIWKVLFNNLLVSDYRNIKFTQAKATFKIADGKVTTEDLILKSIPADISARGWVGFDNTLNFDIVADVRETPLITSSAIQAVPTTIISQVAKNVIGIKLTGSLTNPKIKYKILPLKALKKTGDSIFQGIAGMFEDLLDQ
ncbi:MAG: AsmA family protein [Candidatus Omnitrophica bacterium]|nr:AsmA family protein [Candidatus Omnitrophota bacterium]